jgi:hypothetical protein
MSAGLVYENGRLTRIGQASGPANYDEPGTTGADRWTGDIGVTVRERHVEQIAGGRIDQIDETHLILPYSVGAQVQRGDVLTFTYEGRTETRTAGTIVHSQMAGRVRVDLENA